MSCLRPTRVVVRDAVYAQTELLEESRRIIDSYRSTAASRSGPLVHSTTAAAWA